MMSDKDCKDLDQMIKNMKAPLYQATKKEVDANRGPNDLEEQIRVLEFRNAKLHQHNEKIEREIIELRNKIKGLEQMQVDQFRNKGDI